MPCDSTWTGTCTRTEARLRDVNGDELVMTVTLGPGNALVLQGDEGDSHWTGSIGGDRTRWHIKCRFGFLVGGSCVWVPEAKHYVLTGDVVAMPKAMQLPDEAYPETAGEMVG